MFGLVVTSTAADGSEVSTLTSLGQEAESGWSTSAAARDALGALTTALSGCSVSLASTVAELQLFAPNAPSTRVVDATGPSTLPQLSRLPSFHLTRESSDAAAAVLFAHDYADGLRLTTLVASHSYGSAGVLAAAFGEDAKVALKPKDGSGSDAVFLSDVALDGVSLDAVALGLLPQATRRAIRLACKTQLLEAVQACIRKTWAGGLLQLCTCEALSEGPLAVPLAALAMVLSGAGGRRVPTLHSCARRQELAERLEEEGKCAEAVAL